MTYASRRNIARRQKVQTLKERNRQLEAENAYLKGYAFSLEVQLQATRMERPADLEDWIESVIPDLSPEELEQWEALSDEDRAAFIDALGGRIAAAESLLAD